MLDAGRTHVRAWVSAAAERVLARCRSTGESQSTRRPCADGGRVVVPMTDRTELRQELERFAGAAFQERPDGSLSCDFSGVSHFTVLPDGRVDSGMSLHAFEGPADRLIFDHERGEVVVEADREDAVLSYTFRRP